MIVQLNSKEDQKYYIRVPQRAEQVILQAHAARQEHLDVSRTHDAAATYSSLLQKERSLANFTFLHKILRKQQAQHTDQASRSHSKGSAPVLKALSTDVSAPTDLTSTFKLDPDLEEFSRLKEEGRDMYYGFLYGGKYFYGSVLKGKRALDLQEGENSSDSPRIDPDVRNNSLLCIPCPHGRGLQVFGDASFRCTRSLGSPHDRSPETLPHWMHG